MTFTLIENYLLENPCYTRNERIVPRGIMIHDTGADNPYIKRYVHNDENGLIGTNKYGNHWNRTDVKVCVHAFIGKLNNGTVGIVNTLPYYKRAWHCGGVANGTHISIECCRMLEDREYTDSVMNCLIEYCAYLCQQFHFDPLKDGVLIGHYEGHERGIASAHIDPSEWFPKYGYTMDWIRREIYKRMLEMQSAIKGDDKMIDDEYRKKLQSLPGSEWSKEAREAAVHAGLFTGSIDPVTGERNYMWQDFVTREQLAQVLARAFNLI